MTSYSALARGGLTRIRPYQAGKPIEEVQRELGISEVVKLASNENPFGMSPRALEAARRSLGDCHFYPDSNGFYLKRKLSEKWGYAPERVTLGAGSNELINLLFQAFVGPGDNVVLPEYSFVIYTMEATVNGAQTRSVPLKNWCADLEAVYAAIDGNTRVVVFANPSNPIGTAIGARELKAFVKKVPGTTLVVIDEAYNEFNAGAEDYEDTASWLDECENLVLSRTFSKAYGLAGLRVGYMLTNPEIAGLLNRLRAPFNVNLAALAAAEAAIDDEEHLRKVVDNNTRERERYAAFCRGHGLFMIPSQANFVAVDFGARDAQAIADRLLRRGVIVRPLLGYRLKSILRISIGTPEQNDRLFSALDAVLKGE